MDPHVIVAGAVTCHGIIIGLSRHATGLGGAVEGTALIDGDSIDIVRLLAPSPPPDDVSPRGASAAVPINVRGGAQGDARGGDRAGGCPKSETIPMTGRPAAGVMTVTAVVRVMVMHRGRPTLTRPQASGYRFPPVGSPVGPPRLVVVHAALALDVTAIVPSLLPRGSASRVIHAARGDAVPRLACGNAAIAGAGAAPSANHGMTGPTVDGGPMAPCAPCALHPPPCLPPSWLFSPWLWPAFAL